MFVLIENTPRAYAWGDTGALAEMLGTVPTGEPQAELWLGAHPENPAVIAKAHPELRTLIDLIESDPAQYGVAGGQLPFLLKVLAIGAPLSLQVHPDAHQAAAGFAREELAGIPRDAPERNYGDPHHKPELLVALTEVTALSGFRPLAQFRDDVCALAAALRDDAAAAAVCAEIVARCAWEQPCGDGASVSGGAGEEASLRNDFLNWVFSGAEQVRVLISAVSRLVGVSWPGESPGSNAEGVPGASGAVGLGEIVGLDPLRVQSLRQMAQAHPGDPGILVSLLLHLVRLSPGEGIFLRARQLHAYLSGVAVEVMAASDNVLRAGLTKKHVDIAELCRIVDLYTLHEPRCPAEVSAPGLVAWRPDIDDFQLFRVQVAEERDELLHDAVSAVTVPVPFPAVLVVTAGRVRLERIGGEFHEVVSAKRGQSVYVSAGESLRISGDGEVFLATVGEGFSAGVATRGSDKDPQ